MRAICVGMICFLSMLAIIAFMQAAAHGSPLNQPPDPVVEPRVKGLPPVVAEMSGKLVNDKLVLRIKIIQARVEERVAKTLKGDYVYLHVVNTEREITTEVDYDSPSALRGTEIFDLYGKRVDPRTLLKTLAKGGKYALVSYTGEVDPRFLPLVNDRTYVIVLGTRDESERKLRELMHPKR